MYINEQPVADCLYYNSYITLQMETNKPKSNIPDLSKIILEKKEATPVVLTSSVSNKSLESIELVGMDLTHDQEIQFNKYIPSHFPFTYQSLRAAVSQYCHHVKTNNLDQMTASHDLTKILGLTSFAITQDQSSNEPCKQALEGLLKHIRESQAQLEKNMSDVLWKGMRGINDFYGESYFDKEPNKIETELMKMGIFININSLKVDNTTIRYHREWEINQLPLHYRSGDLILAMTDLLHIVGRILNLKKPSELHHNAFSFAHKKLLLINQLKKKELNSEEKEQLKCAKEGYVLAMSQLEKMGKANRDLGLLTGTRDDDHLGLISLTNSEAVDLNKQLMSTKEALKGLEKDETAIKIKQLADRLK